MDGSRLSPGREACAVCIDERRLSAAISVAFHGLAFAMVLYLISVGLSVTMGLMGFVNLAHGVFADARRLCA